MIPQGISQIAKRLPDILEDGDNELPGSFRQLLARLNEQLQHLDRQVGALEAEIVRWHQDSEASRRLAQIPGIGPLGASALLATVGDARTFARGRQVSAWLGMVPRQVSSGGKATLLGMSSGDSYLRTLLIHGARSVLQQVERHPERAAPWLKQLLCASLRTRWRRLANTERAGSRARCWRMTATTKYRREVQFARGCRLTTVVGLWSTATDCSGKHDMMARQV